MPTPVAIIMAGAEAAMNFDQLPRADELLAQSAIAVKGTFELEDPFGNNRNNRDQGDSSQQNDGADSSAQDGSSSGSSGSASPPS